jgi:hypothetical protein
LSETTRPAEWLWKTWTHYSRKGTFDIDMAQWIAVYPNLLELMGSSDGSFEALPNPGMTLEDGVTPALVTITVAPQTLEQLRAAPRERPGPKTNRTQLTIDGREIDLRNVVNASLVSARVEDVENVAHSYLHQFRSSPTKRQRRRLTCELQRVLTLRGKDVSHPLYGSICLRLGMPLPEDFWSLPGEMLPAVGM